MEGNYSSRRTNRRNTTNRRRNTTNRRRNTTTARNVTTAVRRAPYHTEGSCEADDATFVSKLQGLTKKARTAEAIDQIGKCIYERLVHGEKLRHFRGISRNTGHQEQINALNELQRKFVNVIGKYYVTKKELQTVRIEPVKEPSRPFYYRVTMNDKEIILDAK